MFPFDIRNEMKKSNSLEWFSALEIFLLRTSLNIIIDLYINTEKTEKRSESVRFYNLLTIEEAMSAKSSGNSDLNPCLYSRSVQS